MRNFLNKPGQRHVQRRRPVGLFCVLPLLAPAFLSGCVGGADTLATLIRPGALAEDMNEAGPPVLARLQQPDGDGKARPPVDAPATPPAAPPLPAPPPPSSLQGLPPPPPGALQLPGAPPLHVQREEIKVRAWVNGKPLFEDEFLMGYPRELLTQVKYSRSDPKVKDAEAAQRDRLIDQELMLQDAVNKLDKVNSKVLDKLKKEADKKYDDQVYTIRDNFKKQHYKDFPNDNEAQFRKAEAKFLEELRHMSCLLKRKAERDFIASEYMRSRVIPKLLYVIGPKQIKDEYDSHAYMYVFPGKLKWQDVFIPFEKDRGETLRYAQQLLDQNRDDFKALLKYDKGDSKYRGGEGVGSHPTYQRGDTTVPTDVRPNEMEPHLLKLRDGESTVVEMSNGVHIIRLVAYEPSNPRPFNKEVQMEIRNKMRSEVFEREVKYLIRELRSRADIVIVAD